uniref:Bet v I/Major latex protein domain-containing protein n=1 Tax=Ananas comosus var. bracteatus TaxID=296719 RepID=A0A6V7PH10_ANACO|nr:unnamed protein product [Ananas comosus var. bracteatus]
MSSPASWNFDIESPVAAPRLFRAALLDWHNLAPKFAPEIVVSATVIEGNGGVGSVRQFNFSSAMPFTYTKERLDYVDHDKYESKQTLIEGGGIESSLSPRRPTSSSSQRATAAASARSSRPTSSSRALPSTMRSPRPRTPSPRSSKLLRPISSPTRMLMCNVCKSCCSCCD